MRLKIHIIYFLVLYSSWGYSQKKLVADEFKKTSQAYLALSNFSADVKVFSFTTSAQSSGTLMGIGLLRKSKENYYSKFLDDEMVSNNTCTVIVNHYDKTINYFKNNKDAKKILLMDLPSMDSLIKKTDSAVYRGIVNDDEHFILYTKRADITKTELYISRKYHFLKKVVYYYAPNSKYASYDMYKIELIYENISIANIDHKFFSERKYIDYRNGKPALTPAYSIYKLHVGDQLNKKSLE